MLSLYTWIRFRIDTLRAYSEKGAAAVEYGLLVGLIAVAVILGVYWLGVKVNDTFCFVVQALPFGSGSCADGLPTGG